ncbi:alginate export family protein [Teredinibacter sp. KSP-S5-2]|uniref:alginate export family protein n=1 Tax=Teredinibacter sp. KSP-S5-2 TaxID=3034506 RepID=UPI002934C34E|nr:alginate export family protein [Teredinibacter sp. KSP-S5-2]WNO10748.1 alginate export family protein [Teredinibacter sp. KSP-S5-2]
MTKTFVSLKSFPLKIAIASSVVAFANVSYAENVNSLTDAVKEGKTQVNMRYRTEFVDQDGMDKEAYASTLRTRFTYSTASWSNLKGVAEFDVVSLIGNDLYNSTTNGKVDRPVVVDPEGTDLNQFYLQYNQDNLKATWGRQRILHGNQRFVGGVGWRQNEQTYDGYRFEYVANQVTVDASYVYNINRIVGEDHPVDDLDGSFYLTNVAYAVNKSHKVTLMNYSLDFDALANASSQTWGINYDGQFDKLNVHAAYARQSDWADSNLDYTADYKNLEVAYNFGPVTVKAGNEVLGSDNGASFTTPLATLHKFQGFADKFLGFPANGMDDKYIGANGKAKQWNWAVTYHQFTSDEGSVDYGSEWDGSLGYLVNPDLNLLLKGAYYQADDFATDTLKLWFMVSKKF